MNLLCLRMFDIPDMQNAQDSDIARDIILRFADSYKDKGIRIEVSEKEKEQLVKSVSSKLKGILRDEIEFKVDPRIERGFRIGITGDDLMYDFSDESIMLSLKSFLNPRIQAEIEGSHE
jgi:vacuolar-type H+-ATPase subunit E/Vma4